MAHFKFELKNNNETIILGGEADDAGDVKRVYYKDEKMRALKEIELKECKTDMIYKQIETLFFYLVSKLPNVESNQKKFN